MKITVVPQDFVHHVWPAVADLIDEYLKHQAINRYKASDVFMACSGGQAQLWIAYEDPQQKPLMVAVTRVLAYPQAKALSVEGLAGPGFDQYGDELIAELVEFAHANGCVGLEAVGRPGWKAKLAKYGTATPRSHYEILLSPRESGAEEE